MESVLINSLVPEDEQVKITRMYESLKGIVSKKLADSLLGDDLVSLRNEILIHFYTSQCENMDCTICKDRDCFRLLMLYVKLLDMECKMCNPIAAYAYGVNARHKGMDFNSAYDKYLEDICTEPAMIDITETRGKCRTILRTIFGDSDTLTHPLDDFAIKYRSIFGGDNFTGEFFCRLGFDGGL